MDFIRYHLLNKTKRITYITPGNDELINYIICQEASKFRIPFFLEGDFLHSIAVVI